MLDYIQKTHGQGVENACIIWLHGLGASGDDFASIIPELKLPARCNWRFIFPHAPVQPVTLNQGMLMPAWYDIYSMNIGDRIDTCGIEKSSRAIAALIQLQIDSGISSSRIILAGFSQGGAIAYDCGLSYPEPLGGILALSSYIATRTSLEIAAANQHIPVQIMHGQFDDVVPFSLAGTAHEFLNSRGISSKLSHYPMQHTLCLEQIGDISAWLQSVLNP